MPGATPRVRDPWLDNSKFWLVTLVVIGHAVVIAFPSEVRERTYAFIYQFHMPAFVLVSGYLSRNFRWTRRHLTQVVTRLLVPFAVFEVAMALFRVHVAETADSMEVLSPLWLEPHWPMWFLLVLAMWRLVTPLLLLHWSSVVVAVGLSVLSGFHQFEYLDLNRFFGMLPFFALGLHLGPRALDVVKARWTPLLGLPVALGLWWLTDLDRTLVPDHEWYLFRSSYEVMGHSLDEGSVQRLVVLLIGLVGTAAFLSLVPRRRSLATAMGAASMVVYLFHGFPVQWAKGQEWREYLPEGENSSLLVVIACCVLLSAFLALPLVARPLGLLADPVETFQLVRRRLARPGEGPAAPASEKAPSGASGGAASEQSPPDELRERTHV